LHYFIIFRGYLQKGDISYAAVKNGEQQKFTLIITQKLIQMKLNYVSKWLKIIIKVKMQFNVYFAWDNHAFIFVIRPMFKEVVVQNLTSANQACKGMHPQSETENPHKTHPFYKPISNVSQGENEARKFLILHRRDFNWHDFYQKFVGWRHLHVNMLEKSSILVFIVYCIFLVPSSMPYVNKAFNGA
jgi:hypothetical protein